jgi:hypothetical protein
MDSLFLQFEHFPATKQQVENIYDKVLNNHMCFSISVKFLSLLVFKTVDGFHVIHLPFNRATFLYS